jgi:hypothetical protein
MQVLSSGAMVFEGTAETRIYRYIALKGALTLENAGMKIRHGFSAAEQCRILMQSKTKNKAALLEEYKVWLENAKAYLRVTGHDYYTMVSPRT